MNSRIFDPGPKSYTHLLDRLNRHIDLKYRDYSTALTFSLKATPHISEEHEQEALFVAPIVVEAPQEEMLFPPESLTQ
jgi:hypothetical protein